MHIVWLLLFAKVTKFDVQILKLKTPCQKKRSKCCFKNFVCTGRLSMMMFSLLSQSEFRRWQNAENYSTLRAVDLTGESLQVASFLKEIGDWQWSEEKLSSTPLPFWQAIISIGFSKRGPKKKSCFHWLGTISPVTCSYLQFNLHQKRS